tara:strand:- start:1750 stop:2445 length:696 start_codon:yes stop_codon:yes gene_type:complete
MAKILCIESATQVCSVTLADNNTIIASKESNIPNAHSELLSTFVDEIFKESDINLNELDAIAVSMGPGSYTGLRIGVSAAKGLCFSLEKPLISISTLQSMAAGMSSLTKGDDVLYCPLIDARRMEVYSALFDAQNKEERGIQAEIIVKNSFQEFLTKSKVYFAGDGAEKCKEIVGQHSNAVFLDEFKMSSSSMIEIALKKYNEKDFENVAYFEPYYLKDFIAGKPKVKGLK